MDRLLESDEPNNRLGAGRLHFETPEAIPIVEPTDDVKEQVKARDGFRCLCCGYRKRRSRLQVDHISPSYHGGNTDIENLQTLCGICNGPDVKGILNISFRNNITALVSPPRRFPKMKTPMGEDARNPDQWEMFLRRIINLFFRCAAVESVSIRGPSGTLRHWRIKLFPGNDPEWLRPHLQALMKRIGQAREESGYQAVPNKMTVTG
jgi:hypothetical protein